MNITFPEAVQPYIQPGTTARLVAGTFSMGQQTTRQIGQRQISSIWIQFRNALSSNASADQLEVGSINPASVANGTNQTVLLVVDVPEAANTAQEFMAFATNKHDGASVVVACWCPDGGYGRYLVEQEEFYLTGWLVTSKQVVTQTYTLFLGIFGFVAGICVLGVVLPPLILILLPTGLFFFRKWLDKKKTQGKLLDKFWAQQNMQRWANALTEHGQFRAKYEQAFGAAQLADARL